MGIGARKLGERAVDKGELEGRVVLLKNHLVQNQYGSSKHLIKGGKKDYISPLQQPDAITQML